MTRKSSLAALLASSLAFALAACRSAFIETDIRNDGDAPLHLVEVDYPSASFGMESLNAHSIFHYRFKVQGSGPVTITYTGADRKPRTEAGPNLEEGQQGYLTIAIDAAGKVNWAETLVRAK